MSVLVLSDACNLSCDYCFYSTVMAKKRDKMIENGLLNKDHIFYNKEEAKKIADRLFDSQVTLDFEKKSIVITGWEPTLHPDFKEIMTYFIRKDFEIHLLSNFVFPLNWTVAKFLKKNKKHFRFLVNFNELAKQRMSSITKSNLIDLNYEYIKIGINLYHPEFNFDDILEVLEKAPNIKTIRLWLPNAQADEWINMGVVQGMKDIWIWEDSFLEKYKKDLFEEDLYSISETGKGISYGLLDEKVKEYYWLLGNALLSFIHQLQERKLDERVDFYVDCGFDYKILPSEALGFIMKRLHYKNPCSIPNGVCMQVNGTTQQCYAIGNYWNWWENELSIKKYSISEINNYYLLSSQLLQHWLLNQIQENKFEMCRGNNLRFFKQLFTQWTFNKGEFIIKDYNISNQWDKGIWYELKDVWILSKKYLQAFKETKKELFLIRTFQLFEFLISHNFFEEATLVLSEINPLLLMFNLDKALLSRYFLYEIILNYTKKNKTLILEWRFDLLEALKEQYLLELKHKIKYMQWYIDAIFPEHLTKLYWITKIILQKWKYLN